MIDVLNVTKTYPTSRGQRVVLDRLNFRILPSVNYGILGRNGSGKSTLIRLISGAERPTSGKIVRAMSVSWPLAFGGAFQGSLTGLDNLRFICRVYGVDPSSRIRFVDEFSELGRYLREPVRTYSAGMRARLAFAISMSIEFDCYLIDEVIAVGDQRFHAKCDAELFEKRSETSKIIVSHDPHYIAQHCDLAAVIHDGKIGEFEAPHVALQEYLELQ